MDARTLWEIMGKKLTLSRYEQLLPSYEKMLNIVGASTVNQCAMIAAQLRLESGGLRHQREIWGPTAQQRTYDGRMGNRPGTTDWSDFRGHGWIQVTGRNNHTNCSRWAHQRGIVPTADYFVRNPAELGSDQYNWVGPSWYLTAARPGFMAAANKGDVRTCTQMINGGYTHLNERTAFYNQIRGFGDRLLPGSNTGGKVVEKRLDYSRDQVAQDTFYNCGPASVQTIIKASTEKFLTESELGGQLGTHRGGTDYIGQFPTVLNRHIPGGKYVYRNVPNYVQGAAKDRIWDDLVGSINAGNGAVVNIVAPPSNYPKAVAPSTINPAYSGGTVYHYIAVMGYSTQGQRKLWIADSGFSPYGYWLSFDQLCTLVVPKGYAYSAAESKINTQGAGMTILTGESAGALNEAKIAAQNTEKLVRDELIPTMKKILSESMILNEQFAGPERDGNGNLQWTGWQGDASWEGTDGKATVQRVIELLTGLRDDKGTK